jgi:hypothetical protein
MRRMGWLWLVVVMMMKTRMGMRTRMRSTRRDMRGRRMGKNDGVVSDEEDDEIVSDEDFDE